MFRKVLIANRGEIACRILRTLRRMGIGSVAVYSDADRHAAACPASRRSDPSGAAPAAESYLRADLLDGGRARCGRRSDPSRLWLLERERGICEGVRGRRYRVRRPHAGSDSRLRLEAYGSRYRRSRRSPAAAGAATCLPASRRPHGRRRRIGYPVMLKSTAGGGGIGMQFVRNEVRACARARGRRAPRAQEFYRRRRVLGALRRACPSHRGTDIRRRLGRSDRTWRTRLLRAAPKSKSDRRDSGDGTCPRAVRIRLHDTAIRLGRAVRYKSAGTVEFVYDVDQGEFYFLEVNTRLQVEHCITEEVTGIDLVEWMLRVAANDRFELVTPASSGASIQARIYAEDPARGFRPSSGPLTRAIFAAEARVDTWVRDGTARSPPTTTHCSRKSSSRTSDRDAAVAKLRRVLNGTQLAGIETNLDYLRQLAAADVFAAGGTTTRVLESFRYAPRTIEVVSPGTQTTIQDYPGRLHYWHVGVPPSGPMDSLSFRLGNRAVGNPSDAAALEITMSGPTLTFDTDAVICLTGARARRHRRAADRHVDSPIPVLGRCDSDGGRRERDRMPRLFGHSRRIRRAAVFGQPRYVHLGQIRRPWRSRPVGGRYLAFESDLRGGGAPGSARRTASRHRR